METLYNIILTGEPCDSMPSESVAPIGVYMARTEGSLRMSAGRVNELKKSVREVARVLCDRYH